MDSLDTTYAAEIHREYLKLINAQSLNGIETSEKGQKDSIKPDENQNRKEDLSNLIQKFTVEIRRILEVYNNAKTFDPINFPKFAEILNKILVDELSKYKMIYESQKKGKEEIIKIQKIFEDVPDPIDKFKIISVSEKDITLELEVPASNGHEIIGYRIYCKEKSTNEYHKVAESSSNRLVLKEFPSNDKVNTLRFIAYNKLGESDVESEFKIFSPKAGSKAYMSGFNSEGQINSDLIEKKLNEVSFSSQMICLDKLQEKVVSLKSAKTHLAILDDGKVLQWGETFEISESNELLVPLETSFPSDPFYIFSEENNLNDVLIASVEIGLDFCLAIDYQGRVYSWGSNNFGQLGLGDTLTSPEPKLIQFYDENNNKISPFIKQVSAIERNVAALSDDGKVYTWGEMQSLLGKPEYDRFGTIISYQNQGSDQLTPRYNKEVLDYYVVKKVLAGKKFNMALTECGKIYTWGDNLNGELGIGLLDGSMIKNSTVPRSIDFFKSHSLKIEDISCGKNHCIAMAKNNEKISIYSWGKSNFYQTGHGHMGSLIEPSKIDYFEDKSPSGILSGAMYTIIKCQQTFYCFGKFCNNKDKIYQKPTKLEMGSLLESEKIELIPGKYNLNVLSR